ncbi:Ldh family oxidoreductase [Aquabacter cavernae]|uniref:Ldh family oxidoreductase n=1 Tax=Aquabacter cavernae TaxID=2496029 RepID=UPI000F8D7C91|nr:Ldh family oxidoreductase [Aquabacter cavernae]
MTDGSPAPAFAERHAAAALERFCRDVLLACGADAETAEAATRAMMHGSRLGVDSHGVRLLDHYVKSIVGGCVAGAPRMRFLNETPASATLDAGDGHGALAAYRAMDKAVAFAGTCGVGAVAIRNSSHFGPAGAFALAAAEQGCVGLAFCNSDSLMRLHDGAERFHGTNPIAAAAPVAGAQPWLMDMATSAIPYNRVLLYGSLGLTLPAQTASDGQGTDTADPSLVEMLAPVGGAFGFKGAALAGLVELFSAILSGARLSFDIPPMAGPDMATPRNVGAFVLALRPSAFLAQDAYEAGMARYLETLRASRPVPGGTVLAPGDREWAEAARREAAGIPIDPATARAFDTMAATYGLARPRPVG